MCPFNRLYLKKTNILFLDVRWNAAQESENTNDLENESKLFFMQTAFNEAYR